jgi:hypothetical protein
MLMWNLPVREGPPIFQRLPDQRSIRNAHDPGVFYNDNDEAGLSI